MATAAVANTLAATAAGRGNDGVGVNIDGTSGRLKISTETDADTPILKTAAT